MEGNVNKTISENNQTLPGLSFNGNAPDMTNIAFAYGVAMLTICFFGFVGNILTIAIFTTPRMRSPINTILSGLCIIDMVLLLVTAPLFALQPIHAKYPKRWLLVTTTYSIVYLYPVGMTARTCSVWLFVLITFERYLAVCFPLRVNRISNNVQHAKCAVCTIVALSTVYNLVRFWEFQLHRIGNFTVPMKNLRNDPSYQLIYSTILYLLTHFLAPFLLLIFFNLFIIRCIQKMRRQRKQLSRQQIQEHRTTYMMITLIVIFVGTNTIPYALNIIEAIDARFYTNPKYASTLLLILDTSNLLVLLNSSTNCLIYLVFSKRYRVHFIAYIQCKALTNAQLSMGIRMVARQAFTVAGYEGFFSTVHRSVRFNAATQQQNNSTADPDSEIPVTGPVVPLETTTFRTRSFHRASKNRKKKFFNNPSTDQRGRGKSLVHFYNNNYHQGTPVSYNCTAVLDKKVACERGYVDSSSSDDEDSRELVEYGIQLLSSTDEGSYV